MFMVYKLIALLIYYRWNFVFLALGDGIDEEGIKGESKEVTETSAPLVSRLQPTDLSQHISDHHENAILCVAPAEKNRPESVKDKESECFPLLFPDRKNTFNTERLCKVGLI